MDKKRFFSLFCFVEQSFHFFLLLCYDLGRLLKLTHETRSRSLSYSTSCITGALIKMSVFIGVLLSAVTCLSFYFVKSGNADHFENVNLLMAFLLSF